MTTVEFLASRMGWPPGTTGRSSDAMVREAIGGKPVGRNEFPLDYGDLSRCWIAYKAAPPKLRKRMRKNLFAFRRAVAERKRARYME